jgi:hypothetical protein
MLLAYLGCVIVPDYRHILQVGVPTSLFSCLYAGVGANMLGFRSTSPTYCPDNQSSRPQL